MRSRNEHLLELRQMVDQLKARVDHAQYRNSDKQQDKIVLHLMNRAIQIGEACFVASDLATPVLVLLRVLCEDLLLLFWISRSEENAAGYAKASISDFAKIARVNLQGGRAKVVHRSTGEDKTEAFLPKLKRLGAPRKRIETLARNSGLGKLYDILYRFASSEVHANTFGVLSAADADEALSTAFPAINSLLQAIILIADNRSTPAEEILRVLHIEDLGGR